MARAIDQQAIGAEQAKIHAPGIDADAIERPLLARSHVDAVLDLMPEPQRIPVKRAGHAHRGVGEAVQFRDREFAGGKAAEHGAPALCAQVKGQVVTHETASIPVLRLCPWPLEIELFEPLIERERALQG